MVIEGCITKINQASTGAPMGTDGRRIVFTRESISKCAGTYELMPVNCTFPEDYDWSWRPGIEVFTGHGDINIGVIQKIWDENDDLMAKIVVWKALFPDISFMTINAKDSLGFSIECTADKTHDGAEDDFLYVDEFTGLGCAMLFKNTAAFSGTYIRELVASLQKKPNKKVEDNMNEEQMKALLDTLLASVETKLEAVQSSVEQKVDTIVSEVKAEVDKANTEIAALATSLAETKEKINASAAITVEPAVVVASVDPSTVPTPTVITAGQVVVPNSDLEGQKKDKKTRLAEVWASDKTMLEKQKEIVRINTEAE